MAKILRGNLHKSINVVVDRKVYKTVNFNEEGVYETSDKIIIKELEAYGYKVIDDAVKEEKTEEIARPARKRAKDIDE